MICFLGPEEHNRSVTIRDSSTVKRAEEKGPTFKNSRIGSGQKTFDRTRIKIFWSSWTNSDCSVDGLNRSDTVWWPYGWVSSDRTVTVLFLLIILFLEVISEMSLIAMAFYFEVFGPDFVIMIIRNEARYFSSRRNSISFHYLCMKVSLFSCKPVMNSQSEKLY